MVACERISTRHHSSHQFLKIHACLPFVRASQANAEIGLRFVDDVQVSAWLVFQVGRPYMAVM